MNPLKAVVYNRGAPPTAFLNELIRWGKTAPETIFAVSMRRDIYSLVRPVLGPWRGPAHRRAVMLEVLRVLAGFESSWRWDCGRDHTNPNVDHPLNEETGPFQVSADSMAYDVSLREYIREGLGSTSPHAFIAGMKANRQLAIGYCARLLRYTTNHHGPVKRLEILPWLSRDAVKEFEKLLT